MKHHVTLVGCGALGSHVAQFLRNEAQLRVVDFDRVEQKNVLAQFHGKPGVGKLKVQALRDAMQFLWGVKVDAIHHRLEAINVDVLFKDTQLVIDCVDNGSSRRVIQKWARSFKGRGYAGDGFPCLHGALAADGSFGRVCWDASFVVDDEDGAGAPTCEGGEFLPFVAITAAYIARAAQLFLRDGKKVGYSISPAGAIAV